MCYLRDCQDHPEVVITYADGLRSVSGEPIMIRESNQGASIVGVLADVPLELGLGVFQVVHRA